MAAVVASCRCEMTSPGPLVDRIRAGVHLNRRRFPSIHQHSDAAVANAHDAKRRTPSTSKVPDSMTKSYAQIKAAIAKLEKEAAALRESETTKVVAQIRESIATFGLTVEHLFGRGAKVLKAAAGKALGGGKATRKGAGVPKYRHPKTGKTWTGFGKAPGWIATARNRDKFLINQAGVIAVPSVEEPVAPVAAVAEKSTRKARAVAAPVKTSSRAKKVAATAAEVAVPEAKAEKAVKKAAAKKSAPSKKAPPTEKVAAAPKAAKSPKVAARASKKAASKFVKSQPAAKTRSPRTTTKAAAPVVTSAAPETPETGASAS